MKGAIYRSILPIAISVYAGHAATRLFTDGRPWLALIWLAPVVASALIVHSAQRVCYWRGRVDESAFWWKGPPPPKWWKNG